MGSHGERWLNFVRLTPSDRHFFFGYYDKCPWDASGRYLLAMEPQFIEREPTPEDVLVIGMVDLSDGNRLIPLARTRAWNFQQGCMLRWLPADAGRQRESGTPDSPLAGSTCIIYNDREGEGRDARFVSIIRDVFTGESRVLPRPVYALRSDGKQAVSVPFYRIARTRPGYGYVGVEDPGLAEPHPEDDGIWVMDLDTGDHRLIFALAQAAALKPLPSMEGATHWFNHLQYNPDGTRFLFLHRWGPTGGVRWGTRMLTSDPAGSDVRIIADDGMTSHFDWRDSKTILAWARQRGRGDHFYLFDAMTGHAKIVGEDVLPFDGHCSYSPDRQWVLTDRYPDETNHRTLILYHPHTGRRIDIGRFYSPPQITGPIRCDLHPRWSRDGRQVCIDSVHEGTRGMYGADVSGILGI